MDRLTSNVKNRDGTTLAVHPGALGDVVLFGHFLKHLGGEVTLVAGGAKARLLAAMGVVGRAMDFDSLPMHEVFIDPPPSRSALPALLGSHGRLVSCFASGHPAAERTLAAMCGAAESLFLPVRPPRESTGHLLDLWCDLAGRPRICCGEASPWPVPHEWRESAGQALRQAGVRPSRGYYVLHAGAGAEDKRWPVERFAALASLIRREWPEAEVVAATGPVESDKWSAEAMGILAGACTVLPPLALEGLAGLLAGCNGFVGNDSGPAHLAAATGVPVAVVASPASTRGFLPVGRFVTAVQAQCLKDVASQAVLSALAALTVA